MKYIYTFCFFLVAITNSLLAQQGKDNAKTIASGTTIVNEYTSLTADITSGSTVISVVSSSLNSNNRFGNNLSAGDLIMIIQVQGATIKTFTTVPGQDSTYGEILAYNTCGNYEMAQVKSVPNSASIEVDCPITNNYSTSGKTQIVRIPRYTSLTINSGGVLTGQAWNGSTGGIVAVEAQGITTINTGGSINANGLGFRGGNATNNSGFGGLRFNDTNNNPDEGGEKGESIAGSQSDYATNFYGKYSKGAPANGGGGGNSHNCGGGGGANAGNTNTWNGYGVINSTYSSIYDLEFSGRGSTISSGGGKGGYGFSGNNEDPSVKKPGDLSWGGANRPSQGGFGGRPLDYSTGKLFLGGGGGAGHVNDIDLSNGITGGTGGNGGGLVYLLTYSLVTGNGSINSNGIKGTDATGPAPGFFSSSYRGKDAGGGGGGGGTIVITTTHTVTGITCNAIGGVGGSQIITKGGLVGTVNEAEGPGGGGGGGYVAISNGAVTQSVSGGNSGTTNSNPFQTAFPPNGATNGDNGLNNQIIPVPFVINALTNYTTCLGSSLTLTATTTNTSATIDWFNQPAGGTILASGNTYTTTAFTTVGTYTYYVGSCPGIYRIPIIITVVSGTTLSVNSPSICAGQNALLTVTGALNYTWTPGGNTTNTLSVSPASTDTYTVTGTDQFGCMGTVTSTVFVGTSISIGVTSNTICIGESTLLTASGAINYTWTPSGVTTSTINVSPNGTTIYTVTGTTSLCSGVGTGTVTVNNLPTITATNTTICSGQTATLTANGATSYTWNPGAIASNPITVSPLINTTYTVIGNDGNCNNTTTVNVNVTPTPTLTVNSPTICNGGSTILSASGASSFTWTPGGVTSNTMSVNPSTTTQYTVTGSNGTCQTTTTTSVTTLPLPTLSVNGPTSTCQGSAITLVANGGINYTWLPFGVFNDSLNITPNTNTTYTLQGSNGTCATSITGTVGVLPSPTALFSSTEGNVVTVGTTVNFVNNSTNALNYLWDFDDNTTSTLTNPTHIFADTGTYCIQLIAINSLCKDTTENCILVTNVASILIPNVFTPNGDGSNDLFKLLTVGIKTLRVTIYDRWGLKLKEWNDTNTGWDGKTPSGQDASAGTYFYTLEYSDFADKTTDTKGFITLIRD